MELNDKQKNLLFKAFLFGMIEVMCFLFFITISGLTGTFEWTVEQLTTTPLGMVMQILNLVVVVAGIVLFLYFLAFIITLLTS